MSGLIVNKGGTRFELARSTTIIGGFSNFKIPTKPGGVRNSRNTFLASWLTFEQRRRWIMSVAYVQNCVAEGDLKNLAIPNSI